MSRTKLDQTLGTNKEELTWDLLFFLFCFLFFFPASSQVQNVLISCQYIRYSYIHISFLVRKKQTNVQTHEEEGKEKIKCPWWLSDMGRPVSLSTFVKSSLWSAHADRKACLPGAWTCTSANPRPSRRRRLESSSRDEIRMGQNPGRASCCRSDRYLASSSEDAHTLLVMRVWLRLSLSVCVCAC